MKKIGDSEATPTQEEEFQVWANSMPGEPLRCRPVRRQALMPLGIAAPLIFVGGLIGALLCVTFWAINAIVAVLLFIAMPFIIGIIAPVCGVLIAEEVYDKKYRREMIDTGWTAYDSAMINWKQEGRDKFTALAQKDYLINIRLKILLDLN